MNMLLSLVRFIVGLYFFLYIIAHALIFIKPETASYFIFMNLVNLPKDLKNPNNFGLSNVHNFYLKTEADVEVGVWHFIPEPLEYNYEKDSESSIAGHFETYFKKSDGRPIILYVHGNDGDRSRGNRIGLCSKLRAEGYHVFAIDYRGYGDSTGWPSEQGVVKDVMALYNFIKAYQKASEVYIWGHSLGTGISSHAAKVLSEFKSPPHGVILEAPFLNISKAAKEYIIAPLFLNNPWIIQKADEALDTIDLRFNTDKNIVKINSKILILHAADDWFIPQQHSLTLIEIAKQERPADYPPVQLVEYHEDLALGHNNIYMHDKLYPTIKKFIGTK